MHWRIWLLAVFALGAQSFAAASPLPASVQQALAQTGIPVSAVAVVARPVAGNAPTLNHRGDAALNPASLMKLVTTTAALEMLGPATTWRTDALVDAPPDTNGVLAGDLYLRGSGDPKLTYDRLWLLLRELRARGVREIRGDLVIDRSAFAPTDHERKKVEAMSGYGLPIEKIAVLVRDGIDTDTLRKHFAQELISGKAKANAQVGKTLFQKVMAGDPADPTWTGPLRDRVSELADRLRERVPAQSP